MVVDDDPLVRRSVARVLGRAGYEVLVAKDVVEATEHASSGSIHAALVDYTLAGETGLTVLEKLRRMQPSCVRMLITGRTDFPTIVQAVNNGQVAKVLPKPLSADALREQVATALAEAKKQQRMAAEHLITGSVEERRKLARSMRPGALKLVGQPIFAFNPGSNQGRAVAYEALLRSTDKDGPSPTELFALAERYDQVADLGDALLPLTAGWLDQLEPQQKLFVNLHPAQLSDPARLVASLAPLADRANRVVLEITERQRLATDGSWEQAVATLRSAGFGFALDDLGSGYSTLAMLAELQPEYIKLDRSLIDGIDQAPRKGRLVGVMTSFAAATNAVLIAEGVERSEELHALFRLGVRWVQGYLLGRPGDGPVAD